MASTSDTRYSNIAAWFQKHPTMLDILKISYTWIPRLVEAGYLILLLLTCQTGWRTLARYVLIPAVVFGLVSIMRHIWDFPRPYEQGRQALIQKDKKGHSFPSRHVASAVVIAWVWLNYNIIVGSVFGIVALLIAVIRVLAGVHYVRDVAAGAGIAVLLAAVLEWLADILQFV